MPSEIRDNGILLADNWELVPIDSRNWELCQRYVSQARGRHKGGTEPTWHHCGRFYSSNTIDCALLYVADQLMKDRCRDEAMRLDVAAAEWRDALRELERAVVGGEH